VPGSVQLVTIYEHNYLKHIFYDVYRSFGGFKHGVNDIAQESTLTHHDQPAALPTKANDPLSLGSISKEQKTTKNFAVGLTWIRGTPYFPNQRLSRYWVCNLSYVKDYWGRLDRGPGAKMTRTALIY
jgi:hypothetical protein